MTTKLCELRIGNIGVEILCRIGQVMDVQTWNSTHVRGGGAYSDAYGNVRSAPVSSYNVKHNQFFLRTREGQELDMKMTNLGVGLRAGHEITLILGKKSDHWEYVGILNHNTLASEVWPQGVNELARVPYAGFLSAWACLGMFFGFITSWFGLWALSEPRGGRVGTIALVIGILLLFSGLYSLIKFFNINGRRRLLGLEIARILYNLKGYQAQAQAALRAQR